MHFSERVRARLEDLERRDLLRTPRSFSGSPGPTVMVGGREAVCLASNDYLGLAADPRLSAATCKAARLAAGAGASRLITGTLSVHREAERALAAFVGVPEALLFSSGYAANVGVIQSLAGPDDLILSDALNHASIIDGCRLSRARVLIYSHGDADDLGRLLKEERCGARAVVVVSETVFSMDGDLAPVARLRRIADEHQAGLVLDEAHALGVVGPKGAGVAANLGVKADALVGTLGKAFGLMGAFVGGSTDLIRLVTNQARSFVFSTATSPALAGAIPTATAVVGGADDRRERLHAHSRRLRDAVRSCGHVIPSSDSCVVPVILGEPRRALEVAAAMLECGVYVQPIRPPTVPVGTSRLRLVPSASHQDVHIERACDAIRQVLGS